MHHGRVSQTDAPPMVRRDLSLPSGPVAALDTGPGAGTGHPVLLVPGYTGSKEDFALILAALAAAGHRAVAVDQRGQFESPGPDDPAAYSLDSLARDVLALLAELAGVDRGPVHLVGHSFGGLVARVATIAAPGAVASLTLLDSGPAAIDGGRRARVELLRPLLDQGMPAVFDAMDRLDGTDWAARPAGLRDFLRRRFVSSSPVGLRVMGDTLLSEPDRTAALRGTGVPLLVAYGEGDDAWPPAVQAEMAGRLGARHVVIRDAMHSPAMENPVATVTMLLGFWAAVEGR